MKPEIRHLADDFIGLATFTGNGNFRGLFTDFAEDFIETFGVE